MTSFLRLEALLHASPKTTLQSAAMLCHHQTPSIGAQRKAVIVETILKNIEHDEPAQVSVCEFVFGTITKPSIYAFLRSHGVAAALARCKKADLVAHVLADGRRNASAATASSEASRRSPSPPSGVMVPFTPTTKLHSRLAKKWCRLAKRSHKKACRRTASTIIKMTIDREMVSDYTQSIGDLWQIVLREVGHTLPKSSATMRAFFFTQVMKFYKTHRLVKKSALKDSTWCRRGSRKKRTRGTRDTMMEVLELGRTKKEDILSGPL